MAFSRSQQKRPSLSYSGKCVNPIICYQRLPNDLARANFNKQGSRQGHILQVNSTTNENSSEQERRSIDQIHSLEETEDWDLELILPDDLGASIRDAIKEGTCLVVRDVHYKNNNGE